MKDRWVDANSGVGVERVDGEGGIDDAPVLPCRIPSARRCSRGFGTAVRVFGRAGLLEPVRPDRLVRATGHCAAGGSRWPAASPGPRRSPDRLAVIDERRAITFDELHRRSNALAHGLLDTGVREHATVAVLCRNHCGFVETTAALAKLGADRAVLQHRLRSCATARGRRTRASRRDRLRPGVRRGRAGRGARRARFRRPARRLDHGPYDRRTHLPRATSRTHHRPDRVARSSSRRERPGTPRGVRPRADDRRRSARRVVLGTATAGRRSDRDRRAPLPFVGVRHLVLGTVLGIDRRRAAALRAGRGARRRRRVTAPRRSSPCR